jgi:hypothetical protein
MWVRGKDEFHFMDGFHLQNGSQQHSMRKVWQRAFRSALKSRLFVAFPLLEEYCSNRYLRGPFALEIV